MDFLSRIKIVLCRPEGSLNIGSVCRAMKTMGISRLTIVNPARELNEKQIKDMSVHAYDIYQNAEWPNSLADALAKCSLSAGISRRRGSKRKFFSLLPEEFASKAMECQTGDIALVFGNEQHGLTDKELSCCQMLVHIPSHPECPSLNLSHAVQILCYSMYRSAENKVGRYEPITHDQLDHLTDITNKVLRDAGFFTKPDRFNTPQFLRDIFGRARLSTKESKHLERIMNKIRFRLRSD